jgi:nucleotide-binding universal stress UspA family protein
VTAYPDAPSFRERLVGTARRESIDLREVADNVLARAAEEAGAAGLVTETYAEEGDPAHVLIDVAQQQGADLIVVGARGLTGLERFLLGSVSSKLAHHAPCSVTIVRQR